MRNKLKGKSLSKQQCCKIWSASVRMNSEFLENVWPFLLSLVWCTDKRAAADEMLTAALPLNTLAQPDAAAKHTHTATHTDCAHHTPERKQICLCLLTNSHPPAQTVAYSITNRTLRPWKKTPWACDGLTAFLFFFLVPRGFLAFSMTA